MPPYTKQGMVGLVSLGPPYGYGYFVQRTACLVGQAFQPDDVRLGHHVRMVGLTYLGTSIFAVQRMAFSASLRKLSLEKLLR
jgi:dipeptide/tripeptide permease